MVYLLVPYVLVDDLKLNNDIVHGNVTIDPAGTAEVTDSTIDGDLTGKNMDKLTLDNDKIGGNIILDNIDKVIMNKVTGDDTLYISKPLSVHTVKNILPLQTTISWIS